jgi:hypothetical protein
LGVGVGATGGGSTDKSSHSPRLFDLAGDATISCTRSWYHHSVLLTVTDVGTVYFLFFLFFLFLHGTTYCGNIPIFVGDLLSILLLRPCISHAQVEEVNIA